MEVRIHPTHKRYTRLGVGLLALPAGLAGIASVLGLLSATSMLLAFGVSAAFLLPWILWRNIRCQCPQCGAWLRVDRESGRSRGGPQLFRCNPSDILWDDQMERGTG